MSRLISLTLAFVMGAGLLSFSSGCVVRVRGRASLVADEAPPPPRYQPEPSPRVGYVWVRGHWEWRNGRWEWQRGYWKAERRGYVWVEAHWERRGNRYHFVPGRWEPAGSGGVVRRDHRRPPPPDPKPNVVRRDHRDRQPDTVRVESTPAAGGPTQPPPAKKAENRGRAPGNGYVWVSGYWKWNGRWVWQPGHWARQQAGKRWVDGHWERRGNVYVWVEGRWE